MVGYIDDARAFAAWWSGDQPKLADSAGSDLQRPSGVNNERRFGTIGRSRRFGSGRAATPT